MYLVCVSFNHFHNVPLFMFIFGCLGLEDWDIVAPVDIPQKKLTSLMDKNSIFGQLTEQITSHVGKTVSQVTKAMGIFYIYTKF